ncbi:RNA-binding protein [Pseudoflavitalea sp. G-6-1-2]|uniref:RNA recognition motif domain-containing protein n=1 Tax=Pseudoflavitalea sp. G-6-1-2 TaxID=2728841 RepID=UPI00146A649E|nr:RNA-binding protein [Pseudoflavitalea sp. G-6-1-2]NML21415.1 RNA-binding protein [Pseudoflavitalea sp. G-6-1-2]
MKIAITNLNSRTTVDHLKRLLFPFGNVRSVTIEGRDPAGRSSCTGIVRIDYRAGLMAIERLNNLLFMNFYLEVYELTD